MFAFSNYSTKAKYYNNLNKLVIGKVKDNLLAFQLKFINFWYVILIHGKYIHCLVLMKKYICKTMDIID